MYVLDTFIMCYFSVINKASAINPLSLDLPGSLQDCFYLQGRSRLTVPVGNKLVIKNGKAPKNRGHQSEAVIKEEGDADQFRGDTASSNTYAWNTAQQTTLYSCSATSGSRPSETGWGVNF